MRLVQFSVDSGGRGVPLYPMPWGPRGFWKSQTLRYSNIRKKSASLGLSLFTRTPPCIPRGPQVRGHRSLPQPSPRPPAPPPRALPPPSPARPGRCFYPAKPSPTRVAACSRELIPAGRGRRLPARTARLSKGRPPPPLPRAPAPPHPPRPPRRNRAPPAGRRRLLGTPAGRLAPPGPPALAHATGRAYASLLPRLGRAGARCRREPAPPPAF